MVRNLNRSKFEMSEVTNRKTETLLIWQYFPTVVRGVGEAIKTLNNKIKRVTTRVGDVPTTLRAHGHNERYS